MAQSFSEDPKAIFAELEDELVRNKGSLESKVTAEGEVQYVCILGNRIRDIDLELFDHREWSGVAMEKYPKVIPSGVNIYVLHQGTLPEGSKGGFAFVDASARMWLIAYDYQNNKVYVEAGSSKHIDWKEVKAKLDASSSNFADHKDPIRGAWVAASVSDTSLMAFFQVDHSIGGN